MKITFSRRTGTTIAAVAVAMPLIAALPANAEPATATAMKTCSHTLIGSENGKLTLRYLEPEVARHIRTSDRADGTAPTTGKTQNFAQYASDVSLPQKALTHQGDITSISYGEKMTFAWKDEQRIHKAEFSNVHAEVVGSEIKVYGDLFEESRNSPEASNGLGHENLAPQIDAAKEDVFLFGTTTQNVAESAPDVNGTHTVTVAAPISQWGELTEGMKNELTSTASLYAPQLELQNDVKTACIGSEQPDDTPGNTGSLQSWMKGEGPSIFGIGSLSALIALLSSLPFLAPMFMRALPSLMQGNLPK